MKKLLLTSCAILGLLLAFNTSSYAQAQEGRIQIGPGLAYGTEVEKLGISVDGYYTINEQFRAGAALTYFFPESNDFVDINYFAVDLNGNYIFYNEDQLMAYGIAGLNIFRMSVDSNVDMGDAGSYSASTSSSEVGLNIGAGIEYGVNFGNLVGELTYAGLGGDVDQLVLKAGLRFDI